MRFALACAVALFVLFVIFGCISGPQKNEIPAIEPDLLTIENVSLDVPAADDIGDGEIDAIFSGLAWERENVSVVYFYRPGCSACIALSPWVDQTKKKYGDSAVWYEYDTATNEGWTKYQLFAHAYGVPLNETYVPMVYVGGNYSWGIDAIRTFLESGVDACHLNGCYSPFERLRD